MGPSGSGKSTLMHILAGLDLVDLRLRPDRRNRDHDHSEDQQLTLLRREHVGFIFQFFNLLPMLNAVENITLPLDSRGTKPDKAWLDEIVGKMGLVDRRAHRPSELSGGQQQRVAIARALYLLARPSCSRTSRPATSTRRPGRRS